MLLKRLMSSARPVYHSICNKLTQALNPTVLEIKDNSEMHAEHEAMRGLGYMETHFDIFIVSSKFRGMGLVARHRLVYDQLDHEFKHDGLHAVNIKAKTPEEYEGAAV